MTACYNAIIGSGKREESGCRKEGELMKTLFAPGCALRAYRPDAIEALRSFLYERGLADDLFTTCCKAGAPASEPMRLIVCCPGCSHHFGTLFPNAELVSLWKILLDTDFPFPDYHGARMSIHDSCPARQRYSAEMQVSARALCSRMHITLAEPVHTRENTVCCGGCAADRAVRIRMAKARAAEFPERDVVIYCTGCTRSFSVTDRQPRHLLDLLFNVPTQGLTLK